MTDQIIIGFLGVCAGLMFALFANVVVLPRVLRQQEDFSTQDRWIFGGSTRQLATMTTLAYRVIMPIVFAIVGAVAAINIFGDVR